MVYQSDYAAKINLFINSDHKKEKLYNLTQAVRPSSPTHRVFLLNCETID